MAAVFLVVRDCRPYFDEIDYHYQRFLSIQVEKTVQYLKEYSEREIESN